MTIPELYNKLAEKTFQDPETGNLFWPAYIYLYEPAEEYRIQEEIIQISERLKRPDNYVHALVLNIFEEFVAYLKASTLGPDCLLDEILEEEKIAPASAAKMLEDAAREDDFFAYINKQVVSHLDIPSTGSEKKTYVFIHGFGQVFPYLRTHIFLSNFEKYTTGRFKLIIFYPGSVKEDFSLFNILEDKNPYRAIKLINNPYENKANI